MVNEKEVKVTRFLDLNELRTRLRPFGVDVEFATLEKVQLVLNPKTRLVIRSTSQPALYETTTALQRVQFPSSSYEDPAILFEWGMTDCAVILTIDEQNNVLVTHFPFFQTLRVAWPIAAYNFSLCERIDDESVMVVTGMNDSEENREFMRKALGEEFPSASPIFVEGGLIRDGDQYVNFIIFIPGNFTKNGRSILFFGSKEIDELSIVKILCPEVVE
ncbi:MAG: hypothetical protein PHS44_07520 [Candidatus Dojkabacteria bacterium]|nr:hypothetical protein [Candidatus Dojkabacteria bacterium]